MEQHTYPYEVDPEDHWAMKEAWAILDTLKPGAIANDIRYFLAGMITGTLIRLHKTSIEEET